MGIVKILFTCYNIRLSFALFSLIIEGDSLKESFHAEFSFNRAVK